MKLAACGKESLWYILLSSFIDFWFFVANLPDSQVGLINIADFILFILNQMGNKKYLSFAGLEEPSDCIAAVLMAVASQRNLVSQPRSSESETCKLIYE